MSLAKLVEKDMVKDIISQNVDGLHLKSGVPSKNLHEVHGNTNLEKCSVCEKTYLRDYNVREVQLRGDGSFEHSTGRFCDDPKCKGELLDTIINFGEPLNDKIQTAAFMAGFGNDVFVCAGSSLRVGPVNMIPMTAKMGGAKLVIINLQKTHLSKMADLEIFAKMDDVFEMLMAKMDLEIPEFKINRNIQIQVKTDMENLKETYTVTGIDGDR